MTTTKTITFSFQRKNSNFDRVFSFYFFWEVIICIYTNDDFNENLECPTFRDGFQSIKAKLKTKELGFIKDFVKQYKGTLDKQKAKEFVQKSFNLSDCVLTN